MYIGSRNWELAPVAISVRKGVDNFLETVRKNAGTKYSFNVLVSFNFQGMFVESIPPPPPVKFTETSTTEFLYYCTGVDSCL